jgi:hypothetical protein
MNPSSGTANPLRLALVSPCSTCKNQLTAAGPNGQPTCPRRVLQAGGATTTATDHLVLYGTEGTANEGDGSYRNPVYWTDGHAILVWIALLGDNGGVYDGAGNPVTPGILDPGFDTSHIQCRPLPIVPRDSEAAYFQHGALAENDQLEVSLTSSQQQAMDTGAPVLIDGFGKKVSFVFNHPRTPVNKDLCPAGT